MSGRQVSFSKYQTRGDDYVVIDNRRGTVSDVSTIAKDICRRNVSVGANGVVVLGPSEDNAFTLDLWNANGEPGTLSGNGTGCGLAFANKLCILGQTDVTFEAYDGVHRGRFNPTQRKYGLSFHDLQFEDIQKFNEENYHVDVGRTAHVQFVDSFDGLDIARVSTHFWNGKYKNLFDACINFCLMKSEGEIIVRTFQVGLGELQASGIGAVAVALVRTLRHIRYANNNDLIGRKMSRDIQMVGGSLTVSFEVCKNSFTNIELVGPATHVFDGTYYY